MAKDRVNQWTFEYHSTTNNTFPDHKSQIEEWREYPNSADSYEKLDGAQETSYDMIDWILEF